MGETPPEWDCMRQLGLKLQDFLSWRVRLTRHVEGDYWLNLPTGAYLQLTPSTEVLYISQ